MEHMGARRGTDHLRSRRSGERDDTGVDVVAHGVDGAVWMRHADDTGWGLWFPLGGQVTSGPSISSDGTTSVVAARGVDGGVWVRTLTFQGWTDWYPIGGLATSDPGARGDGQTSILVRGVDGHLWSATAIDNTWTWNALGYGDQPNTDTSCTTRMRALSICTAPTDYVTGTKPDSVVIGDLNGDGHADWGRTYGTEHRSPFRRMIRRVWAAVRWPPPYEGSILTGRLDGFAYLAGWIATFTHLLCGSSRSHSASTNPGRPCEHWRRSPLPCFCSES